MKNVSRSKFLSCFRPVVDMDLMLDSKAVVVDRSRNHQAALTYVGVKSKEDMKPSTTQSSVSDTENSIMIHRPGPGKKTFSQAKRVKDVKGIDGGSYSSKHNFRLSSHDKLLDRSIGESVNKALAGQGIQDAISKSNSISSISSCSSSSSSSSPNSTQKPKSQQLQNNYNTPKQEGIRRGCSSSSSAIFLLVICLAVTIFWGKFCAILCTTIWLYFIPRQQAAGVSGTWKATKGAPKTRQETTKRRS